MRFRPAIIEPTDAIVRIDSSTICGSDVHILKGDVPDTAPGTVLGHEAVGAVVEVGAAPSAVSPTLVCMASVRRSILRSCGSAT